MAFCLLVATPAAAQFTLVSGTVTDTNGVAYANGLISFQLVPLGGSPTLSGLPYTPPTGPIALDNTGSFTAQLADNNVLLPAGTKWKFSVTSPVIALPVGNGPQLCSATLTITGASQSISSSFNACPLLVNAKVTATLFPLLAPNGSAAAPSYGFSGSSNSGMFLGGGGGVHFSTLGTDTIFIQGNQIGCSGTLNCAFSFFNGNAGNLSAGALSATRTYTLPDASGTMAEVITGTVAGSTTLLAANSCGDAVTATITGATISMVATASPQSAVSAGLDWNAFVSAANTVTVQYCNVTTLGITPAAATFNIRVIQ